MAGQQGDGRISLREVGAAVLIYGLLSIHIFKGALFYGPRVVGAPDTETYPFLWGFFWMAESVLADGQLPYSTQLMDFPTGGVLWLKEPIFTFLCIPITALFGVEISYTITQISHCVLAGLGLSLSARLLGLGTLSSLIAGVFYAFVPHTLGEAYNGNLDAMNIEWASLWLAAMIWVMQRADFKSMAVAAGALWLLLVGNQYFALAMAMFSAVFAPLYLLFGANIYGHALWRRAGAALGGVLGGLLLFAPFGKGLLDSTQAKNQLTLLNNGEQLNLEPPHVSDLLHLWDPLAVPAALEGRLPPFQDLVYPGLLLVLLALLAPLIAKKRLWPVIFTLFALFFISLSLGPAVMYHGEILRTDGEPIWLPWHYLIENTPVLNSMTLPHRMAIPAGMCLAMTAAYFLQGIRTRVRHHHLATGLMLAVGVGAFVEICLYPPYRVPLYSMVIKESPHAAFLGALEAEGAVLNLPPSVGRNEAFVYFLHQAKHKRPIAASFRVGTWPSAIKNTPLIHKDLAPLLDIQSLRKYKDQSTPDDPYGMKALRDAGYGFVVFHADLALSPDRNVMSQWNRILGDALGPALVLSDHTAIFALDPAVQSTLLAQAQAILPEDEIFTFGDKWAKAIDPFEVHPRTGRPRGQLPYSHRLKNRVYENAPVAQEPSGAGRTAPVVVGDHHLPPDEAMADPAEGLPTDAGNGGGEGHAVDQTPPPASTGDAGAKTGANYHGTGHRFAPQDHPPPGVTP